MSRMKRRPTTTKSEHWLRLAIEKHGETLNSQIQDLFRLSTNEEIVWLSPLKADDYAEYRDQSFLELLEIGRTQVPLSSFWPSLGPQWDGLAKTRTGKYILVEAKAYPGEAKTKCQAANPSSLAQIERSLDKAKAYFGVPQSVSWTEPYYQYANRLTHLYFMSELNGLDAFLLFLNFVDAPDITDPCSAQHWEKANQELNTSLGLTNSIPQPRVATLNWRLY